MLVSVWKALKLDWQFTKGLQKQMEDRHVPTVPLAKEEGDVLELSELGSYLGSRGVLWHYSFIGLLFM